MSQYSSRIHIRVKSKDDWEKLYDIDSSVLDDAWLNGSADEIFDVDGVSFIIDGDWSCFENELETLVYEVSSRLGSSVLIFADTTNINVDPYTYLVYYLGDGVHSKEFSCLDDSSDDDSDDDSDDGWGSGKMWGFHDNADIDSIAECLSYCSKYGGIDFTAKEIKTIESFGIHKDGTEFEDVLPNFGIPDSIELSGTQYEGRIPRIEKVKVGDEVTLIREPDNEYDSNAIDVRNSEGSLGHMSADACEVVAPLLDKGKITYSAKIDSVTPLSKRSKRCKTALISIHIDAVRK